MHDILFCDMCTSLCMYVLYILDMIMKHKLSSGEEERIAMLTLCL